METQCECCGRATCDQSVKLSLRANVAVRDIAVALRSVTNRPVARLRWSHALSITVAPSFVAPRVLPSSQHCFTDNTWIIIAAKAWQPDVFFFFNHCEPPLYRGVARGCSCERRLNFLRSCIVVSGCSKKLAVLDSALDPELRNDASGWGRWRPSFAQQQLNSRVKAVDAVCSVKSQRCS